MNNTLLSTLATILLVPLVPAFILYKFLPAKTTVSGPFKGLNLKLTGAFGGYFLLTLIASGLAFFFLKNEQKKTIDDLQGKLAKLQTETSNHQTWTMEGSINSSSPKETKMFFDKTGSDFLETGDFRLKFAAELDNGIPDLPKALCIFNKTDGYTVINLNRSLNANDIQTYKIRFDDSLKHILIANKINIKSKSADSLHIAVALYKDLQLRNVTIPDDSKIRRIIRDSNRIIRNSNLTLRPDMHIKPL